MDYDFGIEKALWSGKAFGERLDDDDLVILAGMIPARNTKLKDDQSDSDKSQD